jgi:hypothetical protein
MHRMAVRYRRPRLRVTKAAALPPGATGSTDLSHTARTLTGANAKSSFAPGPISQATEAALAAEGMDNTQPLAPGRPLAPYWPANTPPRAFDYQTSHNITSRPRSTASRLSFDTLKAIIGSYDVARMCIEHRQDDIRALEWRITAADDVREDVSDQIAVATRKMRKPDGTTPFDSWQSSLLEDVLRFDAGSLYKRRLRNGTVSALEVVDGTTIAPLLDYEGRRPTEDDAPAFVQFIHGLPAVWLTDKALIYQPFRQQPESPYGLPPIEWMLLGANTDIRFQAHFLAYFTEGTLPAAFMESPPEYAHPDQIQDLQSAWDEVMEGDQAQRRKIRWVPFGSKPFLVKDAPFDPAFPEWLLRKCCAAFKVKPNDLGFTDTVNRSVGDVQSEVQARIGRKPLMTYLKGIYDGWLQDDLGLPVQFMFATGEERDDKLQEANTHKVYVEMGAESVDEVRENVLGLPVDPTNPVPRFTTTRSGLVPLSSIFAIAGTDIDPDSLAPRSGSVEHIEEATQPAVLSGQENKVSDIVGGVAKPPAPAALPPAAPATTDTAGTEAADGADDQVAVAKELGMFIRFAKTRKARTVNRPFAFTATPPGAADALNTLLAANPDAAAEAARRILSAKEPK